MMNRLPSASTALDEITTGVRFFAGLPRFLRQRVTVQEARAELRQRLERRSEDFLLLARRGIYENPGSPYRALLEMAGCEFGDLARLVEREGIEGALVALYRHGVYLSVEELKGRRPARRGNMEVTVGTARLHNPLSRPSSSARSSGSGGSFSSVPVSLASERDRGVNMLLSFAARGAWTWTHALWGVPGSSAMGKLIQGAMAGLALTRWFSQVDPADAQLPPRYRWSTRVVRWASLIAGTSLPWPEYVPLDDPLPIARWMRSVLDAGGTPHLLTYASPAVRLCQTASRAGIDLAGAQLTVSGEPLTASRVAAIRAVGACAVPSYGSSESGNIGKGCLAPEASDDLHLSHDLNAAIQPGDGGAATGLPGDALLISSMRPTAKLILLNVSSGDRAHLARRECGCPMEELGWHTHLRSVRSFEKLTLGGMTFLDVDVIRVIEDALPTRFGGGPTSYQLVEEEGKGGYPCLRLLIHPNVGPVDEADLAEALIAELGRCGGPAQVMAMQWRHAGFVRVEHRPPLATASGKILHLHRVQAGSGSLTSEKKG